MSEDKVCQKDLCQFVGIVFILKAIQDRRGWHYQVAVDVGKCRDYQVLNLDYQSYFES